MSHIWPEPRRKRSSRKSHPPPERNTQRRRRRTGAPAASRTVHAERASQPWLYGEPVARSVFDVYLHDRRLFYHKAPCVASDIRAGFYLHIKPVAIDSLPPSRRLYGFGNFDFGFHERGTIADGQCLGIFPLPAYAVSSVQTGQVSATGEELWRASISTGGI